ncbi:uncharacterized protein LOC111664935, partial [Seriola lalandi dorsalis]
MPQNEMSGLSTNNKPNQESKHELQTLLGHMPEMKSNLKEKAGQSDRAQNWTDKGQEATDLVPDQLQTCVSFKNDPDPIPAPSIQDAHIAVTIKQERIEPDVEAQAHVEVTPAIQSPAVHGCAYPLATDSETIGTFAQTHHTCQETPENRQQQERSDSEIQDTEKTSPVISSSPDPFSSTAPVNTEQQNQSRSSLNAELVPKHPGCSPGPAQHSASQALPKISRGERTQGTSNLSKYLSVKGLEPVGLGCVWECKGTSETSFYLCESCSETLSLKDIFQHL